jgi:hypothetical protein
MIVFDLKCGNGHRFEAWFRDSATYDVQAAAGEVSCAVCGDTDIAKALMAPNITTGKDRDRARADHPRLKALLDNAHKAMRELRQHVEATHENVGASFPEEVRKMHYGETEERPVYGDASLEDARDLTEEGIAILPLGLRRTQA